MPTGVRVNGLRQAIKDLQRLGVSVEDLKQAMANISNKVVQSAKALTPVRTGTLQASMRGSKAKNKAVLRGGTKKVNYASFVEYGSIHNTAVEMMHKAITSNEGYMVSQLQSELESLVRRYDLN